MSETKLNKKNEEIILYFNELYPNAKCELAYNRDYEFLIAVMLSAQCTDKKVNKVTPILFSKYNSLEALNKADIKDIEEIIKPLGMFKIKALNIKSIVNTLIDNFNGLVPSNKDELISIKGVGIKTANVVRIELFKEPEFPVDTHVKRIANRLGLSASYNVVKIEEDLKNEFPEEMYIKLHHQFIFFGRYKCKAINPECEGCKLKKYCNFNKNQ